MEDKMKRIAAIIAIVLALNTTPVAAWRR